MRNISLISMLSIIFISNIAGESFFRSNELGMSLEKINAFRKDEFPYILTVIRNEEKTVKTLTFEGNEIKRWEIVLNGLNSFYEYFYKNGELASKILTRNGCVIEEQKYLKEDTIEKYFNSYKNDILKDVSMFRNDDFIYKKTYFYREDGSLRKIRRVFADGETETATYSFLNGIMTEESYISSGKENIIRFSGEGVISEERWIDNNLAMRKEYNYKTNPVTSIEIDNLSSTITKREYDDRKRVIKEEIESDERHQIINFYYEDDLLVSKKSRTAEILEEWIFNYNEESELKEEKYFRNNTIIKITVYTDSSSYYDEIFREGELFLKVYYKDEQKTGLKFFQNVQESRE